MKPDLVFDFGLHKGEDTAFYLAKQFRVVAFEANPELAELCRIRFATEIAEGRLTIVEGAVAPPSAGETLTFFVNERSVWGTIDPSWVERNEKSGSISRRVTARRVDVAEAIRKYGMPFYMKIDIESVDLHVLEVLSGFSDRPKYISIESEKNDFEALVAECDRLRELGYKRFKAVQQQYIPSRRGRFHRLDGESFEYTFTDDASGPFGDEIDQEWQDYNAILKAYRGIFRRYKWLGDGSAIDRSLFIKRLLWHIGKWSNVGLPGWYDTHAALDEETGTDRDQAT